MVEEVTQVKLRVMKNLYAWTNHGGEKKCYLLMEVGRLKSLVPSTELSEPDMMAEGLCKEG